jgi:pSer/pThr/pTyr-binding forkhead associated (FHA) protein
MHITFMNGPADGRRVLIQAESISIGKDITNDIVIDFDPSVENTHIEILNKEGSWYIDNNGNFIEVLRNEISINYADQLLSEDLIKVGSTLLMININ